MRKMTIMLASAVLSLFACSGVSEEVAPPGQSIIPFKDEFIKAVKDFARIESKGEEPSEVLGLRPLRPDFGPHPKGVYVRFEDKNISDYAIRKYMLVSVAYPKEPLRSVADIQFSHCPGKIDDYVHTYILRIFSMKTATLKLNVPNGTSYETAFELLQAIEGNAYIIDKNIKTRTSDSERALKNIKSLLTLERIGRLSDENDGLIGVDTGHGVHDVFVFKRKDDKFILSDIIFMIE